MTTAVASPPSVQSLPHWDSANHGPESVDTMTTEEISRMFLAPKSAPRPQSSSSQSSSGPSSQLNSRNGAFMASDMSGHQINGDVTAVNGDDGGWGPRKKAAKLWPNSSKSDSALGLSAGRNGSINHSTENLGTTTFSSTFQNPSIPSVSQSQQSTPIITDHMSNQKAMLALQSIHPEGEPQLFERKQIIIPFFPDVQKIGRQTNNKTVPAPNNGFFDSKVLSRQHAEVWAERNGKIWIRDVKSSNGTFVNGTRLSQENKESEPAELKEGDKLELGIDIVAEDQKSVVHHKISAKVELAGLFNTASSMLDMMHLDPNTGQPILADPSNSQGAQMRGRGGSQGSLGGNRGIGPGSLVNGTNMVGPQRQVNMWMAPITVEQVVKKLLVSSLQSWYRVKANQIIRENSSMPNSRKGNCNGLMSSLRQCSTWLLEKSRPSHRPRFRSNANQASLPLLPPTTFLHSTNLLPHRPPILYQKSPMVQALALPMLYWSPASRDQRPRNRSSLLFRLPKLDHKTPKYCPCWKP